MRLLVFITFLVLPAVAERGAAQPMSFTPDEAMDRMRELGKRHVAKLLYGGYCRFRNILTGRTNVRNETLAERLDLNPCQLSTSKTELLDAGWVVRDPEELKYGVIPVMGAREFHDRRAWKFRQMGEQERWAFFNSKVKVWDYRAAQLAAPTLRLLSGRLESPDLDNPNLTGSTPGGLGASDLDNPNYTFGLSKSDSDPSLLHVPYIEPLFSAAAAPSDLDYPNLRPGAAAEPPTEICDREYVERVIAALRFPPELDPDDVRRVYQHFAFDCADRQQQPTKKLFLGYLRREAQEKLRRGQLVLPVAGVASLAQPSFHPQSPRGEASEEVAPGNVRHPLRPDPGCQVCAGVEGYRTGQGLYCVCRICQLCFGVGQQVAKGQGARRCPHLTGEVGAREARTG